MSENKKIRWKDHVNKMTFAYNCTRHDSTGFSPFELLFGRKPRLPIDIIFGNSKVTTVKGYPEYPKQWKNAMTDAYRIAAETAEQCAAHGREEYNRKARSSELKPGDRGLVENEVERGGPGKLRSFWEETIYVVLNRKGPNSAVYEVGPENQGQEFCTEIFYCHAHFFLTRKGKRQQGNVPLRRQQIMLQKSNTYLSTRKRQLRKLMFKKMMKNYFQHYWNKRDTILRSRPTLWILQSMIMEIQDRFEMTITKMMQNDNLLSSTTTIALDKNKNRILNFRVNRLYENVQEELEIRQRNGRITA